jgi:hypothetical protein
VSGDERERVMRWAERADREAGQLGIGDCFRLAEITALNPDGRDEAITRLSDGQLVFYFWTLGTSGTNIAEGIQDGRIETDPPGGKIILRASVLAELATVRQVVVQEIVRRAGEEAER